MNRTVLLLFILAAAATAFGQSAKKPDAVVRDFIAAFNAQDVDRSIALTSKDMKWFTVSGATIMTETANQDELRTFLVDYFKNCPSCRSKVSNLMVAGPRVSFTDTSSWKTDKGTEFKDNFAVYEVENGLIVRAYYYEAPGPNGYNQRLAKKLGADDLGMKTYVFVLLKSGPKTFPKEERDKLVAGHLQNIGRLARQGTLVLAGPFGENDAIRGIYVFDVRSKDEAKKLVETDPAVAAGVFECEFRLWYGSAGLLELNGIHNAISKNKL